MFVYRDWQGRKALYARVPNGTFTFASELAPILDVSSISQIDETGLRQFRKLRACFNGRTIFAGVEMFPAGHYLKDGKLQCYWKLPEGERASPTDEEIDALIRESVRMRRLADVSVGSYLSGGLDSTIIATLAGELHTWTVGFSEHNEFYWARLAADRIGSVHHEVLITPDEF